MKRVLGVVGTLALLQILASMVSAQDASVTFLASAVKFPSSPGHAFLVVALNTRNGPKEEALGFYPDPDNPLQAIIGGPGMTKSEFQKNPTRFASVTSSFKTSMNWLDRKKIYDLAETFNEKKYQLTDSNCIDFVDTVARALGLKTPDRAPLQTPDSYVRKLAELNK